MRKGFVDLQVNGWMGVNFSGEGLKVEDVRRVTQDLLRKGTLAYCPTVVTTAMETYRENLAVLAMAMREPDLASHILGIHLEGPFISPKPGARGAHDARHIRPPSIPEFEEFRKWGDGRIAMLTVAPEEPGALDLIRHATAQGVTVMAGHHLASDEAMDAGVAAGLKGCTHVGNGIPNEIHRHHNPLWWQLAADALWGMFITDGHHLPPPLIKVALRAKTVERFVVTSDASPLAGMPPGQYDVFGLTAVISEAGRIYSEQHRGLVGSHATMIECMNHLASLRLLTEAELWQVGLHNPLRVLGRTARDIEGVSGPSVTYADGRFTVG